MLMQMPYVVFEQFGQPEDVLQVEHKRIVPPKKGEVLVRMIARPINPSDLIPITGAYAHRLSLPNIPGYEGVGIVVEVGRDVSPNLIGKRVLPLRGEGTWQEYVRVNVEFVVPIPHEIDSMTAAQMYINPITAYVLCINVLQLKVGDIFLVNACNSSIGRIFAQLANVLGFTLIGVIRNQRETESLLSLGATHIIHSETESIYDKVMQLTDGKGAHAAVDCIGGIDGTNLGLSLRPQGQFITIGLLSGKQVHWRDLMNHSV